MSELPTQTTIELPPPDVHAVPVSLMLADSITVEPLSPTQMRIAEIRQKLDPNGTLPELSVRPTVKYTDMCRRVMAVGGEWNEVYDANDRMVGVFATRPAKHSDSIVEIAYIGKEESVADKEKGIGTAMYLLAITDAINADKILTNDSNGVSEDAMNMWKRLEEKGVAVCRKPFVKGFTDFAGNSTYHGRYVVLPS